MSTPTQPVAPGFAAEPYSIKRHGLTLANCDSEPVQTPGCIQDHGALLALRLTDLTIRQVSENSAALLGAAPDALLGRTIGVVLGATGEQQVRTMLAEGNTEHNPLVLCSISGVGDAPALDVSVHTVDGVVIVEFEPQLASAHGAPDYYGLTRKTIARLQTATSVRTFCEIAAEEVRSHTGFDRVMVYRFHPDDHGEVFAESKRDDLAPWLGLHYPKDDIPRPARDVFKKVWIRPTPDVGGGLAELVPLKNPDTGGALTMTYCSLRGASVMYTEYLQNMGVTAGLTLAIRHGDELWGLIACHHYTAPRFVPVDVRASCEFVAQVVSLQLRSADEREHQAYRLKLDEVHQELVTQAAHEGELAAMTEGKPALLDGLAATGAALYHRNRWWCVGRTPTDAQLDALAEWLSDQPDFASSTRPLYATDALSRDYARGEAFADVASGVLAFPLSRSNQNLMVWFRPETMQTVTWGGNPHDKPTVPGPHGPRLTPRRSFELFVESVRGRSLPWTRIELDAAARLRVMMMELVVSRSERLADLNADLTRSNEELDAFAYVASHDLKEPLRGIHKYAHQLLEDAAFADGEQRRKLQSLMRLTVRMDGLLDSLLHFSRVGRVALQLEPVDMNDVVADALEMVGSRTDEGGASITVSGPLPITTCDRVRSREIFVNLLSNALKYTDGSPRIEVGCIGRQSAHPRPGAPAGAERHDIFFVRDEGIGIPPRHQAQVFKMFKRLHGREEYGGGTGAGLTIVKQLIDRHKGHVWLVSEPGVGTCFYFYFGTSEATPT